MEEFLGELFVMMGFPVGVILGIGILALFFRLKDGHW